MLQRLAVAAAVLAGVTTSACDGSRAVPDRLADGTPALPSKVAFEDIDVPVIATAVRALQAALPAACADRSRAIDRIGVTGASRTSLSRNRRALRACDWTARSAWCGSAYAQLRGMKPRDPRLTITCRGDDGEQLGFLWITPGADTSYIVVTAQGYAEAYRVVRDVPVRVTTEEVDLETSSAMVETSEHARDGRLLRIRRIEAQVSG